MTREKATSKKFYDVISEIYDVTDIFPIYSRSGAIRKPDSGRIVCKTYIFINSNFLSYKDWKQNQKISNTALTLLLSVKVLFWTKSAIIRNAYISKFKRALVLKGIFSETNVCVYLRAKFEVSSIILTSFRQGRNLPRLLPQLHTHTFKRTPKTPTQIRVKVTHQITENERLLLSTNFTAKFEFLFEENAYSQKFHFKFDRMNVVSSKKMVLGIFKIVFRLKDRLCDNPWRFWSFPIL